jgi:hypothetical protein
MTSNKTGKYMCEVRAMFKIVCWDNDKNLKVRKENKYQIIKAVPNVYKVLFKELMIERCLKPFES